VYLSKYIAMSHVCDNMTYSSPPFTCSKPYLE